jgi:hypothetical protein
LGFFHHLHLVPTNLLGLNEYGSILLFARHIHARIPCLLGSRRNLASLFFVCSLLVARRFFFLTLLFSVPTPPRSSTCLDDRGRGNGKITPSVHRAIPPKMTYRFPLLFHLSRGVDHTPSPRTEKRRGKRVSRYVLPRRFHRAIRAPSHYLR